MSYSVNARKANKSDAAEAIAKELDKIVKSQPVHEADRHQAAAAVNEMLEVLPEPEDHQEVNIAVSGSLSYLGNDQASIVSASVSVTVSLVNKGS